MSIPCHHAWPVKTGPDAPLICTASLPPCAACTIVLQACTPCSACCRTSFSSMSGSPLPRQRVSEFWRDSRPPVSDPSDMQWRCVGARG